MSLVDVILLGVQVIIGSASVYTIFNNAFILGLLLMLAVFIIGLLKPEEKASKCFDA
jgi:hypothetical protein